jgi:hypothetical protein
MVDPLRRGEGFNGRLNLIEARLSKRYCNSSHEAPIKMKLELGLYSFRKYDIIYNVVAFLPEYGGPLRIAPTESASEAE